MRPLPSEVSSRAKHRGEGCVLHWLRNSYRLWKRAGSLDQVFITLYDDLLQREEFDPKSTPRAGSLSANRQNSRCRVLSTTDATSLLAPAPPNALRFKLMILHNQRQVDLVESLVGDI